jgi:FkbM family methyltransferase
MNRRLLVAKQWLSGRRNGESFVRLARECFAPRCESRAARVIESRQLEGEFLRIKLKGLPPVWVPVQFTEHALSQVISEQYINWHWHYFDTPETPLTADDVVADCGAAEGLFTLIASLRCKRAFAIEPLPAFLEALAKTFRNIGNVTILPFALSNEVSEAWIEDHGIASKIVDQPTSNPVAISTLDKLYADNADFRPTYLKADVEGFEVNLIEGARNLIRELKPKIAITTYHRKGHAMEIANAVRSVRDDYRFRVKGIEPQWGEPIMLHAY